MKIDRPQRMSKRARWAWSRTTLVVAAAIVSVGLGGVIAFASIPDPSGVIHGCYASGGALRVIDSANEQCAPSEVALDWNQTGPPGPPGATSVTRRWGTGPEAGPGESSIAEAACLRGETVVGGGVQPIQIGGTAERQVQASYPVANGWRVSVKNDGVGGTVTANAIALCASP